MSRECSKCAIFPKYLVCLKRIFVNVKDTYHILSTKKNIFTFTKIILGRRYLEMIAPLLSVFWQKSWQCTKILKISPKGQLHMNIVTAINMGTSGSKFGQQQ